MVSPPDGPYGPLAQHPYGMGRQVSRIKLHTNSLASSLPTCHKRLSRTKGDNEKKQLQRNFLTFIIIYDIIKKVSYMVCINKGGKREAVGMGPFLSE